MWRCDVQTQEARMCDELWRTKTMFPLFLFSLEFPYHAISFSLASLLSVFFFFLFLSPSLFLSPEKGSLNCFYRVNKHVIVLTHTTGQKLFLVFCRRTSDPCRWQVNYETDSTIMRRSSSKNGQKWKKLRAGRFISLICDPGDKNSGLCISVRLRTNSCVKINTFLLHGIVHRKPTPGYDVIAEE